jgi:hypothetical protein
MVCTLIVFPEVAAFDANPKNSTRSSFVGSKRYTCPAVLPESVPVPFETYTACPAVMVSPATKLTEALPPPVPPTTIHREFAILYASIIDALFSNVKNEPVPVMIRFEAVAPVSLLMLTATPVLLVSTKNELSLLFTTVSMLVRLALVTVRYGEVGNGIATFAPVEELSITSFTSNGPTVLTPVGPVSVNTVDAESPRVPVEDTEIFVPVTAVPLMVSHSKVTTPLPAA